MVHQRDKNGTIQLLLSQRTLAPSLAPNPHKVEPFVSLLLRILFPHYSETPRDNSSEGLSELILSTKSLLREICTPVTAQENSLQELEELLIEELPRFSVTLREDAEAIYRGDPAAANVDEVIVAYPGFLAIAVYRLAHWFHTKKVKIVPRMMTEYAHRLTGIDIHPGATIGRSFVIDHGTGIVIGETSIIEDNVKMYQGVTLGALSVDKSLADTKRHPTIEKDVVIYANATILGGSTVVGAGSIIGGNVWLTTSVPTNSRVYHRSDVTVK
jgi:serine O-acetyltransferase